MPPLRIVFMGTAALACPSLETLMRDSRCHVVGVVTQPDKPQGRALKLQPSPVKALVANRPVPVLQPIRARDAAFLDEIARLKPDLIVVAAYGQILPGPILELPRLGCVNVHASLLPRYRGAAPIQWAILNDEAETGVTIMKMDAGLDTGDILAAESTAIHASDTSETLHDRLATMGAALLVSTIHDLAAGQVTPRCQAAANATYARKITKEDGRLDWSQPARFLWNRVRAFIPWPGAFTHLPAGQRPLLLKIWQAEPVSGAKGVPGTVVEADRSGITIACGEGALRVLSLQREGGRRLLASEFLAGNHLKFGDRLV